MTARASSVGIWGLALLAAVLAGIATVRHTRYDAHAPFGDFGHLVTGAECLLDGCDPYDSVALNRESAAQRENKLRIWPEAPVYPPSSLLVVLPLARLGWPAAPILFDELSGLALGVTCVLLAWRVRSGVGPAALILITGLIANPLGAAFQFANPALMCSALAAIGCVILLGETPGRRQPAASLDLLGWLLLGIALALKPQVVLGVALLLLCLPRTRGPACKAIALSLLLLLTGCIAYRLRLGSFHFLAQLRANIDLSLIRGGTSDVSAANGESYDFLNLQAAYSRVPHVGRALVQALAFASAAVLALGAWLLARRGDAVRLRPWTLIALAVLISVMPVYHRGYDRVVALLLVPAAAEMWQRARALAWAYALIACLWIANDTLMAHVLRRWRLAPQSSIEGALLCVLLLGSLTRGREARARPEAAT